MGRGRREKYEFGAYLVQAIKDANMVQEEFYTAVGIKKPYFYDILTGSPPPQNTLEKMLEVLEKKLPPDKSRRNTFFNLAAKCRQEIPADIVDLIKDRPDKWNEIRRKLNELFAEQL